MSAGLPESRAVAAALAGVRARIDAAAARAGRDPAEVALVVVSKGVEPERLAAAVAAGARDVGENRVRELLAKQDALGALAGVRWHLVGTLQRNKARAVAGRVALIHSVDSPVLAEAVGRGAGAGSAQGVLLQVNTSGEPTKHGVLPAAARAAARAIAAVAGVRLRGLMTIAAPGGGARARASFRALRELRDAVASDVAGATELSMGMTEDFEVAVEEGATLVRIGTAIFGERAP